MLKADERDVRNLDRTVILFTGALAAIGKLIFSWQLKP